jgi:ferritin-like metal-binding protein YciE
METPQDRLIRYLNDALGVENGLITNLKEMADDVNYPAVHALLMEHRAVTMQQKDRLEGRIRILGYEPSESKKFLSTVMGKVEDMLHVAPDSYDQTVQDLVKCYGIENFEVAMYEALEAYARAIDDTITADLAHSHKAEEQDMANKILPMIAPSSVRVLELF